MSYVVICTGLGFELTTPPPSRDFGSDWIETILWMNSSRSGRDITSSLSIFNLFHILTLNFLGDFFNTTVVKMDNSII